MIETIKEYLLTLQKQICSFLEIEDGRSTFLRDPWQHHTGGGGVTCVLAEGHVIEKAGVNFSHVYGKALPKAATDKRPELRDAAFQALGVSVVIHPQNPYAPTTHLNVRFICVDTGKSAPLWWFGGGFDLTPYYGFVEDCQHWHQTAKRACDPFGKEVYPKYKKWCDEYFFLKHRNEPRGIGGIFFDDLHEWEFDECFAFMQSVGNHFIQAYQPILNKRKNCVYGQRERDFQTYRRGRYVEFNLLYDRGTLFGIQSAGRTESILISLPPLVSWDYNRQFESDSEEIKLSNFLTVRDWASDAY